MIGTRFGGSWCAKRLFAVSLYVLFLVVFPASKPTFLRKCRVPARWAPSRCVWIGILGEPGTRQGYIWACLSLHCAVATEGAGTGWVRVYSRRAMNKRC